MRLSETATMHASPDKVWAALTDPAVLAAVIPGCEGLEPAAPGHWQFAVTADVASIHGTITGDATVTDWQEGASLTVSARGAGEPGTISATVRFSLAPAADDTTELSYDADAAIGGQLAGVGQRMLASAVTRLAGRFVSVLNQILARNGAAYPSPAAAARSTPAQPPKPAQPAQPAPSAQPDWTTVPQSAADAAPPSFLPGVLAGGAAGAVAGYVAARLMARRGR